MGRLLKIFRVLVAVACLLIVSLTLTGLSVTLTAAGAFVAGLQIMPALTALSLGWLVVWLMVTLLFGRVYCSSVCPLGTLMDVFGRLSRKGREYRYQPPLPKMRYLTLAVVAAALLADIAVVVSLLDPYSAYERIAVDIETPAVAVARNAVAEAGVWSGLWSMPLVKVAVSSFLSLLVAVVTLAVVARVSWLNGRALCNTVCPVGALLGSVSRYSIYHFDIDTDVCTHCRRCEQVCKASCINLDDHTVDGSRCVACFNCAAACRDGALRYTTDRKQLSIPMMQRTRRTLSGQTALSAPAAKADKLKRNN